MAAPTLEDRVASPVGSLASERPLRLLETSNRFHITLSRVIGPAGGTVQIGRHALRVPAGAVAAPTLFTVDLRIGPYFLVDLSARRLDTGAAVSAFRVPLRLELHRWHDGDGQAAGAGSGDPVIAWLKDRHPDGELVPLAGGSVPALGVVVGETDHFSQFAIAL